MQELSRKLAPLLWRTAGASQAILTHAPPKPFSKLFSVAAATAAEAGGKKASTSPNPLSFVLFVPSVVCGYLAYWQLERCKWKEGLIDVRGEKLSAPPQPVYDLQELEDYQKVSCSGRYIHERSIFVGPRPRSIPGHGIRSGYFLITPLYDPIRRGAVMVNRGWVPASWLDDIKQVASAHDAQPAEPAQAPTGAPSPSAVTAGPVSKGGWFGGKTKRSATPEPPTAAAVAATAPAALEIVGILQPSEKPSAVLPDNVPEKLEFHWIDVPALASAVGLPSDTPLVQQITEDPSTAQQQVKRQNVMAHARQSGSTHGFSGPLEYPIPKNTSDLVNFTTMPKDHLIYAGIWSSLCVALAIMARQAVFSPGKAFRMINVQGGDHRDVWKKTSPGKSN